MKSVFKVSNGWLVGLTLCLIPGLSYGHHAEIMQGHPFLQGVSMPIHGLDHLLVAIAIGLLASQMQKPTCWKILPVFTGMMLVGGLLNAIGIAVPFAELLVLLSVLLTGAFLAWRTNLSLIITMLIMGLFAVAHGNVLIPAEARMIDFLIFASGCLLALTVLQLVGYGLGKLLYSFKKGWIVQGAGVGILTMGAVLYLFPTVNSFVIQWLEG